MVDTYVLSDKDLLSLSAPNTLDKEFQSLVTATKDNPTMMASLMPSFGFGVFKIKVFTLSWCQRLISEIDRFHEWAYQNCIPVSRPNSMNKYGVILDQLGFSPFFAELVSNYISPIAKALFPLVLGTGEVQEVLDHHHAFTVEYRSGGGEGESKLGFHVDDAEITVNICCGEQFQRGNIYFHGQRCHNHLNIRPITVKNSFADMDIDTEDELLSEICEVDHTVGGGIIHAGKNRHGVRPIQCGRRVNLIIWCRSSTFRSRMATTATAAADASPDSKLSSSFSNPSSCPQQWCAVHYAAKGGSDWMQTYQTIVDT